MEKFVEFLLTIMWIIGFIIAKGFWSTFFTIIFPPYAWYLFIERVLILVKFLQ